MALYGNMRHTGYAWENQAADVASAATVDLGAQRGNVLNITGSTTITSFGTGAQDGAKFTIFTPSSLTITDNANINCPGGVNLITSAGSFYEVVKRDGAWYLSSQLDAAPAITSITANNGVQATAGPAVVISLDFDPLTNGAPLTNTDEFAFERGGNHLKISALDMATYFNNNGWVWQGSLDASIASLPGTPAVGDAYFITVGGDFAGTWAAAADPVFAANPPSTGDTIVYFNTGWVKIEGLTAAIEVSYDNTTSGLTATDVQAAIDELAANDLQQDSLTTTFVDADLTVAGVYQWVHNLDMTGVQIQIFNLSTNELVYPDSYTVISTNQVDIDLASLRAFNGGNIPNMRAVVFGTDKI